MVRIGWVSLPESVPLRQVAGDLLNSARRAFGYLDFKDPRTLALPFELPFSATGIAAETLLRMMAIYSAVGPKRLPTFLSDAAEVYVETAVFIGLEYKELIARYREHLNDGARRTRGRASNWAACMSNAVFTMTLSASWSWRRRIQPCERAPNMNPRWRISARPGLPKR